MSNTVLFVDDEQSVLNSLERLFDEDGLIVLKANNAEEALELVKNEDIAVIVSDNCMPGMQGVEFFSKVRLISPDAVRIMLTGQAELDTAMDAINNGGIFQFILKPWNNTVLREKVKEGINRFQVIQSLKKADEPIMRSLAQTIELKDKYTKGHCDRVAEYAFIMADALSLPENTMGDLKYGCWLHDCGKIGVPESILNKPGKLTEKEFEIIKNHPAWGAEVGRQAQLSEVIINVILYHHERYDGKGYPFGIKGENIPIEARIVAVADIFDAITTNRSYRKAYTQEEGIDIVLSMREKNLDPKIVDIFISYITNSDYKEIRKKLKKMKTIKSCLF